MGDLGPTLAPGEGVGVAVDSDRERNLEALHVSPPCDEVFKRLLECSGTEQGIVDGLKQPALAGLVRTSDRIHALGEVDGQVLVLCKAGEGDLVKH